MRNDRFKEEYVQINGIQHYMLHYSKSPRTPVLLYLHGGPGFSETVSAYVLNQAWGDLFTHIHWDQRGSGKTLQKHRKVHNPQSIDQMLEDLHGVIEHLKYTYKQDRIVLLGHSWGTLLGSLYALWHPENLSAYIGSGQVINMIENERVGYQKAVELAKGNGNQKQLQALATIDHYPSSDFDTLMKEMPVVRKVQDSYEKDSGIWAMIKAMLKSPVFRPGDLLSILRGPKACRGLVPQIFHSDLYRYGSAYALPIYYILGEDDINTPVELVAAYMEKITAPRKSLTVISGAGHNPMFEQPEAFAEALRVVRDELAEAAALLD